jgi:hypothetical protein
MNLRVALAIVAGLTAASGPVGAQRITAEALIAEVVESCGSESEACRAALAAVNHQVGQLTRSGQAAFGARLAFLVIANPALEPMIRDAVEDSGNVVVAAGYNATNGESEDVVLSLASPA